MTMSDDAALPDGTLARLLVHLSSRDRLRDLNRFLMVPAFRLGLGWLVGSPLGGWIMVLRTRGRRSGRTREAGLDYVIEDGAVYCMAGFGRGTAWFLNLLEEPRVEVLLPGRTFVGHAEEVTDAEERARVLPRLIRASGVPGFSIGGNPWTMSDERIRAALEGFPLVRIRPTGVVAGPADPGGLLWLLEFGIGAILLRRILRWGERERRAEADG
jgi:deazaflavin-dependent oxidoreductase (nitroreductase family)